MEETMYGKDSPIMRAASGEVRGSKLLGTKSSPVREMFERLGLPGFSDKIGIRESAFHEMARDIGWDADTTANELKALRQGQQPVAAGRFPIAHQRNVSVRNAYSIDRAMEEAVERLYVPSFPATLITDHGISSKVVEDAIKTRYRRPEEILREKEFMDDVDEANWVRADEQRKAHEEFNEALAELKKQKSERGIKKGQNQPAGSKKQYREQRDRLAKERDAKLESAEEAFKRKRIEREYRAHRIAQDEMHATLKGALKERLLSAIPDNSVWWPQIDELAKTLDYDGDSAVLSLIKSQETRDRAYNLAGYTETLTEEYRNFLSPGQELTDFANLPANAPKTMAETQKWFESVRHLGQGLDIETMAEAERGLSVDIAHGKLAKYLKSKKKVVLGPEHFVKGSPEWMANIAGQGVISELEKSKIGPLTNEVEATRQQLRRMSEGAHSTHTLLAEALMGVLPESAIKAQQHGAINILAAAPHVERIKQLIGNGRDIQALSRTERMEAFRHAFGELHKIQFGQTQDPMFHEIMSDEVLGSVVDASQQKGGYTEDAFTRALKADVPTERQTTIVNKMLYEEASHSPVSKMARTAAEAVVELPSSSMQNHIRNASMTFEEAKGALWSHKKPMIIGAGLAIATSMLLSSPGSISADEASAAGAKHKVGEPTTPPMDQGRSTSLIPGSGQNVSISGSTLSNIDPGSVSARIRNLFGNSDISMNMSDYREQINEHYIRRRLER